VTLSFSIDHDYQERMQFYLSCMVDDPEDNELDYHVFQSFTLSWNDIAPLRDFLNFVLSLRPKGQT